MKRLHFLAALSILIVGCAIGYLLEHATVRAQSEPAAAGWEIYHGAFGQQSWYAIKLNRNTGETLVLSAEKGVGGDSWLKLPEVEAKKK